MTEAQWHACEEPALMLDQLRGSVSDRKLWLYTAACIGQGVFVTETEHDTVSVIERFGDGHGSAEEMDEWWQASWADAMAEAIRVSGWCRRKPTTTSGTDWDPSRAQANKLRCIVGPAAFRRPTVDIAWLTWNHATVPAIARHVYEDRAFHDLPFLADALEDAGCTDPDILGHCRGGGEHVRGCWVVDLILGKT